MSSAETPTDAGSAGRRPARRLSDKILVAFHQACDQRDYDIGALLLNVLENLMAPTRSSSNSNRRREAETLVAAHERLWLLRHPETSFS